jgi:hypothetical protein
MSDNTTRSLAVFCDFENVALGVQDAKYSAFDIRRVLERLLLKGNIVVKKAYCDWARYKQFKAPMHEASFELWSSTPSTSATPRPTSTPS